MAGARLVAPGPGPGGASLMPSPGSRRYDRPTSRGPRAEPIHGLLHEAPPGSVHGTVVRAFGKYFEVAPDSEAEVPTLLCTVRGTLRRDRRKTDLVAVGDRVAYTDQPGGEGQIEWVAPRTRVLARLARQTRDVEQVILANPDQVLFVFAIRQPHPHRRMLDRFLILAESQGIPVVIGINKVDLAGETPVARRENVDAIFADYRAVYPLIELSVAAGIGLDDLREALDGKITVVAGPSGVGKSSVLNALDPSGERQVGVISDATGKGRHTTTATRLYRLGDDTYVADTPGIRSLAMTGVPPQLLDDCFPEFRPYRGECFYQDCTHVHEPDCAVRDAVVAGIIPAERHASYAALRRGESLE